MTIKQMAQKVIAELPDDATWEDIQYHLYVLECIQKGEKDLAEGLTITNEEVQKRLQK
jgi:hypothetical protein